MLQRCAIGVFMLLGTPAWGGVIDDFESYEIGAFPGGSWHDASDHIDNPTIPSPSASVIQTTNASGNQTQAVQIHGDGIGTSGGIAMSVEHSMIQRFETDIRIDQTGNGSYPNWTYAAGFFQETDQNDLISMPQAVVYSLNNSQAFRLYIHNADGNGGLIRDLSLGAARYELDTWYRIVMEVNTDTGEFLTTIVNLESDEEVINRTLNVDGWNSDFAQYDLISVNDGEYGNNPGTLGNIATIDNVNYVPAPASAWVVGLSVLGLLERRRK